MVNWNYFALCLWIKNKRKKNLNTKLNLYLMNKVNNIVFLGLKAFTSSIPTCFSTEEKGKSLLNRNDNWK